MGKSVINGIVIEGNHKSINVINGKIYVDGKLYKPEEAKGEDYIFNGPIIVNGSVNSVDGTNITIHGDVRGNVDGTNITIGGSVIGDVDGTNVTIKNKTIGELV